MLLDTNRFKAVDEAVGEHFHALYRQDQPERVDIIDVESVTYVKDLHRRSLICILCVFTYPSDPSGELRKQWHYVAAGCLESDVIAKAKGGGRFVLTRETGYHGSYVWAGLEPLVGGSL